MEQLTTLIVSYVLSFVGPELLKLSSWVSVSEDRKLVLRIVSIGLALGASVVGTVTSGDITELSGLLTALVSGAIASLFSYAQHKLVKSVR
ncbi:MAG: hypothetical protein M0R06_09865 [Sphaerochaeta sp.]|jgi:hypothetical protein|nr:hypothetical protein [Sphaerochaeta sp.]